MSISPSGVVSPRRDLLGSQRSKPIERKAPKFVRATVSATRVSSEPLLGINQEKNGAPVVIQRSKRPTFRAPSQPPPSPAAPARRDSMYSFMLTKSESTQLLNNLKKFYNSNKQLLAVSRTASKKISTLKVSTSKVEFMKAQLQLAIKELSTSNEKYTESVREAFAQIDHCNTIKVAHLTTEVANFSSLICAGLKSVAMECKDDNSVFLPVLKSILTCRDSLTSIIESLETVKEKLDKSISVELTVFVKNLNQLTDALLACRSGKLIPLGRKLELESAARAATCSVVKLVNSFSRPIEQSIVYETKVASCCVSQLWATLNELAGTPSMIPMKDIKAKITNFLSELKILFAKFMECTKHEVANPSPNVLEVMRSSVEPLKRLIFEIVAHINLFAEIDTSKSKETNELKITEEHKKRATKINQDPEDIAPPPSTQQAQSIDIPDDAVPDINPIWYEPNNDEGRIVYTDKGKLKCATLNKLLIKLTDDLGKFFILKIIIITS